MVPLVERAGGLAIKPYGASEKPLGFGLEREALPNLEPIRQGRAEPSVRGTHSTHTGLGLGHQIEARTLQVGIGVGEVVTFDLAAGGMISSWERAGVELLSVGTGTRRGIQAGATWTDDVAGELVRHNPVQGGDRFSSSATNRRGGIVVNSSIRSPSSGGTLAEFTVLPIEADPSGDLSIPFVRSDHGGNEAEPVWWLSDRFSLAFWFNYKGIAGLHRVQAGWIPGWSGDVRTGWFDAGFYVATHWNETLFSHLRAYDVIGATDTVVSTGSAGVPGYQADGRRYLGTASQYRGDDEASFAASLIPSGFGGMAFTGATDGDLGVFVGGRIPDGAPVAGERRLADPPRGNSHTWLQVRGGTADQNRLVIAPGTFLSNLIHANTDRRRIETRREVFLESWIAIGTWAAVKGLTASIP